MSTSYIEKRRILSTSNNRIFDPMRSRQDLTFIKCVARAVNRKILGDRYMQTRDGLQSVSVSRTDRAILKTHEFQAKIIR